MNSLDFDVSKSSKADLRRIKKEEILSLPHEVRVKKDIQIGEWLKAYLEYYWKNSPSQKNQSILNLGVYSPLKDEVVWDSALVDLGFIKLCYPSYLSEGRMVFRQCSQEDLLYTRDFGVSIGAPSIDAIEEVPDICLIPGLCFTREGHRLGRGKGYYDRYLENFSGVKIGIAYSEQFEAELPCEEHDQLLDGVISEQGVLIAGELLSL